MKKYSKDALGTRMKGYEGVSKTKLTRRTPVIIRFDGKAFHTWTKQLKNCDPTLKMVPYSELMHKFMSRTALALVAHIQNARLAYVQSDEISILMNDWGQLNTEAWFDNALQKIISVSASIATAYFNAATADYEIPQLAMFDARAWNIPKEEVANYFVWRQQDATRNSINMLAQYHFSHKELQGKNVSQVQDMLMLEKGINWNNTATWAKRGYCVTNNQVDNEVPIFTADRDYIEQHLTFEE